MGEFKSIYTLDCIPGVKKTRERQYHSILEGELLRKYFNADTLEDVLDDEVRESLARRFAAVNADIDAGKIHAVVVVIDMQHQLANYSLFDHLPTKEEVYTTKHWWWDDFRRVIHFLISEIYEQGGEING